MFDNPNRLAPKFPLRGVDALQIRINDERRSWPSRREREHAEPRPENPPRGSGGFEDATLQCALQALRDVRHLLPPEGVAIVDAVLDRAP